MNVLRFKQSSPTTTIITKQQTLKKKIMSELQNTCGDSSKFTIKQYFHLQEEDRMLQSGNAVNQGRVHQLEECISKCCQESNCTLAYLIEDNCYSVSCHSEAACRPIKTEKQFKEPSMFTVIVFIDKRWKLIENLESNQDDLYSTKKSLTIEPESSVIDLPTKTIFDNKLTGETSNKGLATRQNSGEASLSITGNENDGAMSETSEDVATTNNNSNNNSSNNDCPSNQDTLWDTVLKGGWKAGVYTEYKHIKKIDECHKKCCNSKKCNIALVMVHCYLVECHGYDTCQPVDAKVHYFKPHLVVIRPPKQEHGNDSHSRMKKLDEASTNSIKDTDDSDLVKSLEPNRSYDVNMNPSKTKTPIKDNNTDDSDLKKSLGELHQSSGIEENQNGVSGSRELEASIKSADNNDNLENSLGELHKLPENTPNHDKNNKAMQSKTNPKPTTTPQSLVAMVNNNIHKTQVTNKTSASQVDNHTLNTTKIMNVNDIKGAMKVRKTKKLLHDISNKLGELDQGKNTTLLNSSGPELVESDTTDRYGTNSLCYRITLFPFSSLVYYP